MDRFYDSDEKIAWGPVSKKELKDDLLNKPTKIPTRRHSDSGCYTYSTPAAEKKMAERGSGTKPDNSGTSVYFTPNESLQPEPTSSKNEEFLEKLANVVEGETREEMTVASTSCALNVDANQQAESAQSLRDSFFNIIESQEMTEHLDKVVQILVNNSLISSPTHKPEPDANLNPLEFVSNEPSVFASSNQNTNTKDIEVIEVSSDDSDVEIVEDPYENLKREKRSRTPDNQGLRSKSPKLLKWFESDSDEEGIPYRDFMEKLMKMKNISNNKSNENNKSINLEETEELDQVEEAHGEILSSEYEEFSDTEEKSNANNEEKSIVKEMPYDNDKVENLQEEELLYAKENSLVDEMAQRRSEEKENTMAGNSIEEQPNSSIEKRHEPIKLPIDSSVGSTEEENVLEVSGVNTLSDEKQSSFEEAYLARSTENGEDANIDSDRYLDLQSRSGSLVFNDTIDEMDMALKHGLDYKMPDDTSSINGSKVSSNGNHLPPVTKISKLETNKKPQKNSKFHYVQSPIGDYIRKKSPKVVDFKLPLKPARVTPNRPSPAVQTKQLKGIVSPVALYIKNSSEARLKQNVQVKTISNLFKSPTVSENTKASKETAEFGLPQAIYQQPKKTLTSVKNEVTLPPNIRKLVKEPFIDKHEKRVCKDLKETSVSRKLLEEDLTLNQTNEDVSFITKEQAFIE